MSREACPSPRPECPYNGREGGCFSDEHHLFFPKIDYCDTIGAEFRGLPENKEQICRWEHDTKHATIPAPERPPREQMLSRIVTAMTTGQIYLSNNKKRKLNLM